MAADSEAADRAAAAAGLLYPDGRPLFQEPQPKPGRPDPTAPDSGPDLSSFQEWSPSPEAKRPSSGGRFSSMKRNALSIGSQMWAWGNKSPNKTPSQSRDNSLRGGNAFAGQGTPIKVKTPSQSRDNSLRGGSIFGSLRTGGSSREGSAHGGSAFALGDLWNWTSSRGASRSGSRSASPDKFARAGGSGSGTMSRSGSIGARLWSWATESGQPEVNQMRKAKQGPDLSTFTPKGRTFDANGKTHSIITPPAEEVSSSPEATPRSPDKTHLDRGV